MGRAGRPGPFCQYEPPISQYVLNLHISVKYETHTHRSSQSHLGTLHAKMPYRRSRRSRYKRRKRYRRTKSRKGRKRYSLSRTARMARTALRRTRAIETKYLIDLTTLGASATPLFRKIDMPVQGDGVSNRDGDSLLVKSIKVTCGATAPVPSQANKVFPIKARIMLICWKEDSPIQDTDIFQPMQFRYDPNGNVTNHILPRQLLTNRSKARFEVLYDQTKRCQVLG